jgi:NADPH:quinone reductase
MKAIMMNRAGGTEVLEVVDRPDPVPRPGQALIEVAAAGVNFMDTAVRRGQFWTEMPLPRVLGVEGVGRVLAVGDGVHQRSTTHAAISDLLISCAPASVRQSP